MKLHALPISLFILGIFASPISAFAQSDDVSDPEDNAIVTDNALNDNTSASLADTTDASDNVTDADVLPTEPQSENMEAIHADDDNPSVQTTDNADDVSASPDEPNARINLNDGFSLILNVGPNFAFHDKMATSAGKLIDVYTAGLEASLDIGYKIKYFGTYFELMLRGAASIEDDPHYHCPSHSFNMNDICFKYNAIEKGDWDGYFMGFGIMFYGFIPVTDKMLISIGTGFLGYVGTTTDRDEGLMNAAWKLSLGFQFAVNDDLALGLTLNYEGFLSLRQSLQPAFSLIYHY